MDKISVLIPCAGKGLRFLSDIPKQYHKINNKSIIQHTVDKFVAINEIMEIIIIVQSDDNYIDLENFTSSKIRILKIGGKSRAESVLNGLKYINLLDNDWVMVHDAVRCCVDCCDIYKLINNLKNDAVGGVLAIPVSDTLKFIENNKIIHTVERNNIYSAQTPQMFRFQLLKNALLNANVNVITDESNAIELAGYTSKVILGSSTNIKITTPQDLMLAKLLLDS